MCIWTYTYGICAQQIHNYYNIKKCMGILKREKILKSKFISNNVYVKAQNKRTCKPTSVVGYAVCSTLIGWC